MSDKYVGSRLSMEQQKETPSQRALIVLRCLYLIGFGLLAINPHDQAEWRPGRWERKNILVTGQFPFISFHLP
jgi:hypothetical protein